ncbi:MAG: hypothetical protein OHM77_00355 [Candidatus Nitricoxidivorans perseverans]|uniref:Tetratricopeptide repeat protein n=1 Tax=Candidatus Nitricoxidivorans perseverans TaxID=2975601 RepID=A0AA49IVJ2_9PROT|nr:MAG: hypothetical protein OHM77_00355 [Candidatus Nitricoxidivorans perseverans]
MRRLLPLVLCLTSLMPACAGQAGKPPEAAETAMDCGRSGDPGALTRLAMIRKLMDAGRPYAALAHLDAAGIKGVAADHLRADTLRRIGQTAEAHALYRGLLTTCLAGAGHHGLGLLASAAGQLGGSVDHLRQARLALPADARVRSDLGYALMLAGDLDGAKIEFLTAHDLDPEDRKAVLNLILLFYRQGDDVAAENVRQRYQIGDEDQARLRDEAARLATEQGDKR